MTIEGSKQWRLVSLGVGSAAYMEKIEKSFAAHNNKKIKQIYNIRKPLPAVYL
jgi:hypothetical protein